MILRLALMLLLPAAPALACWDGIDAVGERVSLDVYDGAARWSPALAQRYADGIRQIEALLPPGARVEVHFDRVTLCDAGLCQALPTPWRDGELTTLFGQVADAVDARPEARARAAAVRAKLWTVEVARTPDVKQARATLRELVAGGHADPGFLEAGAKAEPTDATYLHVLDGVHSVRVGAFLDRGEAELAAADLAAALGRAVRVRPL